MSFDDQDVANIDPANDNNDKKLFQLCLCSEMMAKWIQGHVDQASWKSLTLKSSNFQWKKLVANGGGYCLDEPTILKLIFDTINPSTEIGTDAYCKMIQNCRLAKHKYNVNKSLDEIKWAYKQITLRSETYNSLCLHVFDLLLSA